MAHEESSRSVSEFQRDCAEYYELLRPVHTGVYSKPSRIDDEINKHRYVAESPPELLNVRPLNLNTFFEVLHGMCGDGSDVHGVDFGCGSHWFVDHVRRTHGWSVVGYDPDAIAIELAKQRYPESTDAYRQRDPLHDGLPEPDASQDFVLSNAVFQHFDDEECERAIAEIARVLKPNGIALLIFKRWTESLENGTDAISNSIRILDSELGQVLFEDPTMKKEIAKLAPNQLKTLDEDRQQGWRMLHLLRIGKMLETGTKNGLKLGTSIPLKNFVADLGEFQYRSGKGMPTVCLVLQKGQP